MKSIEHLLTQAIDGLKEMRSECYHEGYEACERFYNTKITVVPTGVEMTVEPWNTEDAKIRRFSYDCGFQDGFNASKAVEKQTWESPQLQVGVIKAADSESLGQKIEHLIAYFEKRAKENNKRADALDKKARTSLQALEDCENTERSSYFFSGKADSYRNAAAKVQELLGDPEPPLTGFSTAKPEEWITE